MEFAVASFKKTNLFFLLLVIILLACKDGDNDPQNDSPDLPVPEFEEAGRTFTFVNNCDEDIWLAAGGPITGGWQLNKSCMNDSDCVNTSTEGNWECNDENKCVLTLALPVSNSQRFWPRTGCNFDASGQCPDPQFNCCDTGGCTISGGDWGLDCASGGQSPFTVAEITLQNSPDTDFYDVSVIDGFNIPVEVKPVGVFAEPPENFPVDYWCGNPGGTKNESGGAGDRMNIPELDCPWDNLTSATSCDGNPGLRVVGMTPCMSNSDCPSPEICNNGVCGCTSNQDCKSPSTCNIGVNLCQCTGDDGCANGEICGVGNNQIIGYKVCGPFAGCATPKDLCALYFNQSSTPADFLDCNKKYPRTVQCGSDGDCPQLVGTIFGSESDCSCPTGTKCIQIAGEQWSCQMTCESGVCQSGTCSSDDDCTKLPNMNPSGTFMLCDESSGKCVSTNTSLFENTGINGQSCYSKVNTFNDVEFNAVSTFCSGCPTDCSDPPCEPWPMPDTECNDSCGNEQCSNPDWEENIKPLVRPFKKACPAAYSFPFDDHSGTFQCMNASGSDPLNYMITFCPDKS